MATLDQDGAELLLPHPPVINPQKLHWPQILAISIFWFALNFHWAALLVIILPSQILSIAGDAHKGEALAFVLIPGAFVSLFANPLFGMLSDRTQGRLASWGRRRPYIFLGTLVNIGALIWMALSRDVLSLAVAYVIVQFSSNAAQAPFHALLPDIVPVEQRGLTSGVMGLLQVGGTVAGVILAGQFVNGSLALSAYQQGLWLTYGIVIGVLLVFMLITLLAVHEPLSTETPARQMKPDLSSTEQARHPSMIKRTTIIDVVGTILVAFGSWAILTLWNTFHIAGLSISSGLLQVVPEVIVTIGLLRLFDFKPRRDPDFAWVLLTRLVMMMGIYTIQTFLFFYMRDVVGATHPEQQTTNFVIVVSLTSLFSAFIAGWLSDRFGRKRLVYFSGSLIALVGCLFIITQSLPLIMAAAAIFGLGYGAYTSVDWALVADVLPSRQNFARDMGVWNIALSLPQVIAPVIGGPLIDHFTGSHQTLLGYQLLFAMSILYCIIGTVTVRYIRGVKR